MNKRKFKSIVSSFVTFILVIIIVLSLFFLVMWNPFRKSPEKIREGLLELTPIGTSMDDVMMMIIIEENRFQYVTKDMTQGYIDHRLPSGQRRVGEAHISANLGKNSFFMFLYVSWGFDENGLLIDVYVHEGLAI